MYLNVTLYKARMKRISLKEDFWGMLFSIQADGRWFELFLRASVLARDFEGAGGRASKTLFDECSIIVMSPNKQGSVLRIEKDRIWVCFASIRVTVSEPSAQSGPCISRTANCSNFSFKGTSFREGHRYFYQKKIGRKSLKVNSDHRKRELPACIKRAL